MSKKIKNNPLTETKQGKMVLSSDHVNAIQNTENIGTAMFQTAQEYTLAIEDILVKDFSFTEEQLKHLEERLRNMLVTLADVERKGLSVLSAHDMKLVSELAEIRLKRLQDKNRGLILPDKTK